jgi:hypothetical protein
VSKRFSLFLSIQPLPFESRSSIELDIPFDFCQGAGMVLPDLDEILDSLRDPNALPSDSLRLAVLQRDVLIPRLVGEIEKFTVDYQKYQQDCLPIIGLYLLAECQARDVLPTVLECFALDDKFGGYELGDLITENGAAILATFPDADLRVLEAFALRSDISPWARVAALRAMVILAAWNRVSRKEVVQRFTRFFRESSFSRSDKLTWAQLVDVCYELHPGEFMDWIRSLYEHGSIDPIIVSLRELEEQADRSVLRVMQETASNYPPITNTVTSISYWARFYESRHGPVHPRPGQPGDLSVPDRASAQSEPQTPGSSSTLTSTAQVGRNDPCPCGSGKKFKKCCGKSF